MYRRTLWICVTAALVGGRPASAGEPAAKLSAGGTLDTDALVRKAEAIIGVVLENHIDPPTRQEMWLGATRALLKCVPGSAPGALAARISRLTEPEQFREFLDGIWTGELTAEQRAGARFAEIATSFFDGLLHAGANAGDEPGLFPAHEKNAQEQIQANRYVGTGIALRYEEAEKYTVIAQVIPGGPMERAGGQSDDRILKVDDEDARGIRITEMVERLRGAEGSTVTLVVKGGLSDAAPRTLVVTRGPVPFQSLGGYNRGEPADYRIEPRLPIRYVKVLRVNGSAAHDLRKLERHFVAEGVQGVILDLRETDSDDVHQAVLLADALLDGGEIGRLRSGRRVEEYHADQDCLFRNWPLVVLVDSHTSGAGEWVAAALQHHHAAVIVGEPTAGSIVVSSFVAVPGEGDFVRLPTGFFEKTGPSSSTADALRRSRPVVPDINLKPQDDRPRESGGPVRPRPIGAGDLRSGRADDPMIAAAVRALRDRIDAGQGRREEARGTPGKDRSQGVGVRRRDDEKSRE